MKTALIIGGGFAGCAMADQLRRAGGWDVTLVERAPFLGAGVRTMWKGGHPFTFGPRHFLTQQPHLFEYLDSMVPMRRCADHQFQTYVESDKAFYDYPIHSDDIPRMPEAKRILAELDQLQQGSITVRDDGGADAVLRSVPQDFEAFWISSIGPTLYKKFVDGYSRKMWMIDDNKLIDDFGWSPKGVTIKSGPRAAWDTAISAYPVAPNGYDDFFAMATQDARVMLNASYGGWDANAMGIDFTLCAGKDSERRRFDIVINTASPDALFSYSHGDLPYIGREIDTLILPVEFALPPNVYFAYYAGSEVHTRVTEMKKFTLHSASDTLITIERPSRDRNLHYPLPMKKWQDLAQRYFDQMPDGMFSIGRAGSYRYNVDIDDTIDHAMKVMEKL